MFVIVIVNIILLEVSLFFVCIQYCDNFYGSHCVHNSTGGFNFLVSIQPYGNFRDNHCKCHSDRGIIA